MCDFDRRLELRHLAALPNVRFHLQDLFSSDAQATVDAAAARDKDVGTYPKS
jgi:hypothetical protein